MSGWLVRAIEWKKTASSIAETSACPMPPRRPRRGPNGQRVLATDRQRLDVVLEVSLGVVGIEAKLGGHVAVDLPSTGRDIGGGHEGVRLGVAALLVHEKDLMEDLQGLVGVRRRHDLGDRAEIRVDELAEPPAVVERTRAGPAGDEQLEAGRARDVFCASTMSSAVRNGSSTARGKSCWRANSSASRKRAA